GNTLGTFANNVWTQNGMLIGTMVADAFSSGGFPFQIPGGFNFANNGFNIVFDNFYTNTGFYKEVALLGRNFMEPFSMNGSAITICGVPNATNMSGSNVCITLAMNNPPNIGHPGLLPLPLENLRHQTITVNSTIAQTLDLAFPQITPSQNGTVFYIGCTSPGSNTIAQNFPLGYMGSSFLQAGGNGFLFIAQGVAGQLTTGSPNGFPSAHITWGPGGLNVQTAAMTAFDIPGLTTTPASFLDSAQLGGAFPNQTFTFINGVQQGATLLLISTINAGAGSPQKITKVQDTMGNTWVQVFSYQDTGAQIFGAPSQLYQDCWIAQNVVGAAPNACVVTFTSTTNLAGGNCCLQIQGALPQSPAQNNSQILEAIN
ncbi:MAG: hypothetical protein HRJ53_13595, partial [Acidobacteria bacterium Pan2503]|nr:hypothetical protein [Candidatus Acidoferrum panamensis]